MPLDKIKAKTEFLRTIAKAVEDARRAGVRNAMQLTKKVLDARLHHKGWKEGQKK